MEPRETFLAPELKQRPLDTNRVKEMTTSQQEFYQKHKCYNIIMTLITFGCCPQLITRENPYGLAIIDGQHRLAVLGLIKQFAPETLLNQTILIKIYLTSHVSELREYFIRVNQNYVPVSEYFLDQHLALVIDRVIQWFSNEHGVFFKSSNRPQRPFLSVDGLKL